MSKLNTKIYALPVSAGSRVSRHGMSPARRGIFQGALSYVQNAVCRIMFNKWTFKDSTFVFVCSELEDLAARPGIALISNSARTAVFERR